MTDAAPSAADAVLAVYEAKIRDGYVHVVSVSRHAPDPDHRLVDALYVNMRTCFPKAPMASAAHDALVDDLSIQLKRIGRDGLRPRKEAIKAPRPSKTQYRMSSFSANFLKQNKYRIYALQTPGPQPFVYASCRVHFEGKHREIHDVCSSVPGSCKVLIGRVVRALLSKTPGCKVSIYCENENTGACKCYHHVFDSLAAEGVIIKMEKDDNRTIFTAGPAP